MKKSFFVLFTILSSNFVFASIFNAYTAHLPPFNISMEEKGISHEILEELAKRTGNTINIKYLPWKRAQFMGQKDPKGLVFSMSRSKNREAKYTWLVQIAQAGYTFVSMRKKIDSIDDAKKASNIVVLNGTPRAKELAKEKFTNFETKNDPVTASKFLTAKRADTWYTLDVRAKYIFKKIGFDLNKLLIGKPTKISKLWIGGNKNIDKSIIPTFEKALKEMKSDGTYQKIMKKYLGN